MGVLAESISHFEVPLFRLCAGNKELAFRVFYVLPVKPAGPDATYGQVIDWGFSLLEGYESERVAKVADLPRAARRWGADVMLLYGYGFAGAPRIVFENWWRRQAQIHRGTLNYTWTHAAPSRGA